MFFDTTHSASGGWVMRLADARRDAILDSNLRFYAGVWPGLGVGLAFVTSRMLGSLLSGVERTDPLTYVGVVAVLGGVALLASLLPAYRATRIDPIIALRHD